MENNGQVPIIAERDRYRKQLTNASKDPHSAKKRSTGLKKKTPDQMKLHNFFEMNVMER